MSDKQKTIGSEFTLSGIGLHTGAATTLTFKPAPDNHGFVFERIDLEGRPRIPALLKHVASTNRGTSLQIGDAWVHTTEHALAALYGLGIDNCHIELDGPEIPLLDGSSKFFVEEIEKVGIVEQEADKNYLVLQYNNKYEFPDKQVEMLAVPDENFRITVMVDYQSPLLGTQHAQMHELSEFKSEVSNCRTFVFLRELMQLVNAGLIKGGDANKAIVMVDTELSEDEKDKLAATFNRDKSELQKVGIGILNNLTLHYENEPARHKLLDIVGDLALIGRPIKGHILAARPGHHTNVEFGKQLAAQMIASENKAKQYDATAPAIIDINRIKELLPHRYPFLLIDKIIEMSETHVVGVKNVTANEEFFQGHFPGNPVMPGVLMVEAMAQTGGIMVLNGVDNPEKYDTLFAKIDKVKFKQKVLPGDSLVFKLEMMGPVRRGLCQMKAVAMVREKIVAEGELMAQIVKRPDSD